MATTTTTTAPPVPAPSSSASSGNGDGEPSFITKLFNMDGQTDGTEQAFLWLMVFGVIVMTAFLFYILARIFCYDFWARCALMYDA